MIYGGMQRSQAPRGWRRVARRASRALAATATGLPDQLAKCSQIPSLRRASFDRCGGTEISAPESCDATCMLCPLAPDRELDLSQPPDLSRPLYVAQTRCLLRKHPDQSRLQTRPTDPNATPGGSLLSWRGLASFRGTAAFP